jgi:hypothetical protein
VSLNRLKNFPSPIPILAVLSESNKFQRRKTKFRKEEKKEEKMIESNSSATKYKEQA